MGFLLWMGIKPRASMSQPSELGCGPRKPGPDPQVA